MKRLSIVILLALMLALGLSSVAAAVIVDSGTCGANLTWTLNDEGLLTISGTGKMADYSYDSTPWYSNRSDIKSVVIGNGVTSIGRSAFYYCKDLTSVTIPNSVTSIGEGALTSCGRLTSVTIPDSVTSIGQSAFAECTSLTSVTIPNSVNSIGYEAFLRCSNLTSVTIPDSVTSIGGAAFAACSNLTSAGPIGSGCCIEFGWAEAIPAVAFSDCSSLTSVTIPDGVKSIGDAAFRSCGNLSSVNIPDSVISIGKDAFDSCSSLTEIKVNSGNANYSSQDGVLFNKDKTQLICCPAGKAGTYTIPNSVTSIGKHAFRRCRSLTSVTIPNSVKSIGEGAFAACSNLTSAGPIGSGCSIEFGWTDAIPAYAFSACDSLTSVTIPNSVISIGDYAFLWCYSLTSVIIPNSVTSIGEGAFQWCSSLTGVTILDSVTSIGEGAFAACSNLTSAGPIGSGCSIEFGWTDAIPAYAFSDCDSLTSVTIPNTVNSIGYEAFMGCSNLSSMTIPNSVTSIGDGAFQWCDSLTSVTIPANVSIGSYAFSDTALYNDQNNWDNGVLYIDNALIEAKDTISGDYVVKDGTTVIAESAFSDCDSLTGVTIPDSVINIGKWAFYHCDGLTNVTIPSSVTSIGPRVFLACDNLKSIVVDSDNNCFSSSQDGVLFNKDQTTLVCCPGGKEGDYVIPDTVAIISDSAFSDCSNLTKVTIPESVTDIEDYAFLNCHSLTGISVASNNPGFSSVDGLLFSKDKTKLISFPGGKTGHYSIPDGVTSIEKWAFYHCDGLTGVTIPDSVITVDVESFCICENLAYVTIGNGVTTIEDRAFMGCNSLTEVTMPGSVTSIGCDAFVCNTLTDVYFIGTPAEWNSIVIDDGNDDLLNANLHFLKVYKNNGVQVSIAQGVLGSKVEFRADKLGGDAVPDAVPADSVVYDLYFENEDEERVQPSGSVTVSIPVPKDMEGSKCKVYYIDEQNDQQLTDMHATYDADNGVLTFTTDHFSYYAVVEGSGYTITLNDRTKNVATITGIANGDVCSGEKTFTVTSEQACVVAYKAASDEEYTVLTAPGSGSSRSFTVQVDEDTEIFIGLVGDVDLDGDVDRKDATLLSRFVAQWKDIKVDPLTADIDGAGGVARKDATLLSRRIAGWTTVKDYFVWE